MHIASQMSDSSFIMIDDDQNNNISVIMKECRYHLKNNESISLTPAREYYDKLVFSKSDKYNVEPSLVSAMIQVESNWNYKVISRSGAIGLMQLMPATAKHVAQPLNLSDSMYEPDRLYQPQHYIQLGTHYLEKLLDE